MSLDTDEKIAIGFLVLLLASSAALLVWFPAMVAAQSPLAMPLVLMFTIGSVTSSSEHPKSPTCYLSSGEGMR